MCYKADGSQVLVGRGERGINCLIFKQEAYKEAKIMAQLKHPNIINYREVYKTVKGKLCIVMDYAEGNLFM